jgi:hypothetical protein
VGPDEEQIIAKVAEMRYAAFTGGRVAHGGRDVDAGKASPCEPNGKHRIEVKSPPSPAAAEYSKCGSDGIEAKSKEGILSATPECFHVGEKVSDSATFHTLSGGIRPELRDPAHKRLRIFFGNFDKGKNHLGWVLTVGVHHKRVSEALLVGEAERVEDCGAFAGVLSEVKDAQSVQPESLRL